MPKQKNNSAAKKRFTVLASGKIKRAKQNKEIARISASVEYTPMKTEYIYYLIDPRDNVVRYVGKTANPERRYKQHLSKLDKLMTPKRRWIEELFALKLVPKCKVVERCEGNGREREQFHVSLNEATILNIHNPAKGVKSFAGKFPKINGK